MSPLPYGPHNPHQFDDSRLQRGNPEFPNETYFSETGMPDPAAYERMGRIGQQQYYVDRQQANAYRQGLLNDPYTPRIAGSLVSIESQETQQNPTALECTRQGPYPVRVDLTQTISEMVKAGEYEIVDGGIEELYESHTPSKLIELNDDVDYLTSDIELISFNFPLPAQDCLGVLKRLEMRFVTAPELLALGAAYPDLQRTRSISTTEYEALQDPYHTEKSYDRIITLRTEENGKRRLYYEKMESHSGWYWNTARFAAIYEVPRSKKHNKTINLGPGRAISPGGVILPGDNDINKLGN